MNYVILWLWGVLNKRGTLKTRQKFNIPTRLSPHFCCVLVCFFNVRLFLILQRGTQNNFLKWSFSHDKKVRECHYCLWMQEETVKPKDNVKWDPASCLRNLEQIRWKVSKKRLWIRPLFLGANAAARAGAICYRWLSSWDTGIVHPESTPEWHLSCKWCKRNWQTQFKHCGVSYSWKNVRKI